MQDRTGGSTLSNTPVTLGDWKVPLSPAANFRHVARAALRKEDAIGTRDEIKPRWELAIPEHLSRERCTSDQRLGPQNPV